MHFKKISDTNDPLSNRARAYLEQGKLKMAVENFGRFCGSASPEGLWGDFQYITNLSFIMGIPGKDKNGSPYPWAVGKKELFFRKDTCFYTYGTDSTYWGPTVSESWFDRSANIKSTDWEAVEDARLNLHNPLLTAGKYYGAMGLYTNELDQYPLIASSTIPETWPGSENNRIWPGHWAIDPNGTEEMKCIFVSDQDIYFEFDDRFATRDAEPIQGYPMGVKAKVSGYSFADTMAEDIIIFNMTLTNESEYYYEGVYAGLYFDVDSYHRRADGSWVGRTNDDDMMGFNDELDLAFIYDLDGDHSNPYVGDKKLAWSAVKLLATPLAASGLDLNSDGLIDIYPGDRLGLTSWHWFDWYYRPGARYQRYPPWPWEGPEPVSQNKEEIQYKILAGDTTNLTTYDSLHYFHPVYKDSIPGLLNPRFDSIEGLKDQYPDGLDCVFMMASGPFNMQSGETVPFSFCVLMGEDEADLIKNAETARKIYKNNYLISKKINNINFTNYRLEQNYPNPFNHSTIIKYELPQRWPQCSGGIHVELTVYNALGQKVRTLVNGLKGAGVHSLVFNSGNLASGLYFCKIKVEDYIRVIKMMLLK